ncbi:hypothetical protein BIS06_07030, partial [Halomonas sp. BBD48]|nr:hypothetical protein [Halomonas sp. BBD48]
MGTNTLSDMKRTPLSLAIGGALLMSASPYGWAQETQTASSNDRLATITVEGNRLYEMLPSEQTAGYDVDAATVGTKVPAALRDIPQSITV